MYAASDYSKRNGRPARVADLARHQVLAAPSDRDRLRALGVDFQPAVVINDRLALRDAVVAGAGIGILPMFLGEPLRVLRQAEPVLPRLKLERAAVTAVYLPAQARDPRLTVFVSELQQQLRELLSA
jgi:DNA-binding transcriptional LysR family regulator